MKELTDRQKEVLSFISEYISRHSFPPTIRDIAEAFEMSVKGAHDHVAALKRKGCIKQDSRRPRTLEIVRNKTEDEGSEMMMKIPLMGTVAAGIPSMSEENWEGTVMLHRSMLKRNRKYFALRVRGDSMSGAGIMEGDTAIIEKQSEVRNGEIAVAVIDDAFTLKRFFRESSRIKLQAENPAYKPIYCRDVRIIGRLAQIIRGY